MRKKVLIRDGMRVYYMFVMNANEVKNGKEKTLRPDEVAG